MGDGARLSRYHLIIPARGEELGCPGCSRSGMGGAGRRAPPPDLPAFRPAFPCGIMAARQLCTRIYGRPARGRCAGHPEVPVTCRVMAAAFERSFSACGFYTHWPRRCLPESCPSWRSWAFKMSTPILQPRCGRLLWPPFRG